LRRSTGNRMAPDEKRLTLQCYCCHHAILCRCHPSIFATEPTQMHNDSKNIIRRQYHPTRVFHRIVQLYYYIYNLYISLHLYRTLLQCMGNYILWALLRKNRFHVLVKREGRVKKHATANLSQRFTDFSNRRFEWPYIMLLLVCTLPLAFLLLIWDHTKEYISN